MRNKNDPFICQIIRKLVTIHKFVKWGSLDGSSPVAGQAFWFEHFISPEGNGWRLNRQTILMDDKIPSLIGSYFVKTYVWDSLNISILRVNQLCNTQQYEISDHNYSNENIFHLRSTLLSSISSWNNQEQ